jgi:sugar O-acyltransferase (sialic acid O-acetyltransferase NeuD family)
MSALLIVGAGGHGKIVADIARNLGRWGKIAFLDDKYPGSTKVSEWEIIGKISDANKHLEEFRDAVVAIGANSTRLELLKKMLGEGFHFPVLIHPDASVSRDTALGIGTVVCVQSAIDIDTEVGMGVIINAGATIAHDCRLGDGVHVSPGGRVSGGVKVGECTWIGSGAIVREMVSIGTRVVVGAGSVVIRDVPDQVTVVGVPSRVIKSSENKEKMPLGEYH